MKEEKEPINDEAIDGSTVVTFIVSVIVVIWAIYTLV
jgi:hypothetical protein